MITIATRICGDPGLGTCLCAEPPGHYDPKASPHKCAEHGFRWIDSADVRINKHGMMTGNVAHYKREY